VCVRAQEQLEHDLTYNSYSFYGDSTEVRQRAIHDAHRDALVDHKRIASVLARRTALFSGLCTDCSKTGACACAHMGVDVRVSLTARRPAVLSGQWPAGLAAVLIAPLAADSLVHVDGVEDAHGIMQIAEAGVLTELALRAIAVYDDCERLVPNAPRRVLDDSHSARQSVTMMSTSARVQSAPRKQSTIDAYSSPVKAKPQPRPQPVMLPHPSECDMPSGQFD
jgi:hypothetical protein